MISIIITTYREKATLPRAIQAFLNEPIKEDYEIEIAMLELMGGKKLYITPGKSSVEIDYSKPLTGRNSVDFVKIMNTNTKKIDMIWTDEELEARDKQRLEEARAKGQLEE